MTNIIDIEGIGTAFAAKFSEIGITTLEQLLEAGSTPNGRKSLADQIEIGNKLILKWVNRADLFRVKGIGEEFGDLLEMAGVDANG